MERPELNRALDSRTFRDFYFLKEELVDFCRENGLPTSGGKIEITDRIAHFLDTGEIISVSRKKKMKVPASNICLETKIEPDFVCTEKHRAFFKEHTKAEIILNMFKKGYTLEQIADVTEKSISEIGKIVEKEPAMT